MYEQELYCNAWSFLMFIFNARHACIKFNHFDCVFLAPKPCDAQPCKNEGVCQNVGSSFSCACVGSYEGKTCEGIV